jgi:hypothetical protein
MNFFLQLAESDLCTLTLHDLFLDLFVSINWSDQVEKPICSIKI